MFKEETLGALGGWLYPWLCWLGLASEQEAQRARVRAHPVDWNESNRARTASPPLWRTSFRTETSITIFNVAGIYLPCFAMTPAVPRLGLAP
jgi:hypothetical protein